ncbi:hypothetical protein MSTO_58750 [Mycobacterium stomatepiae]|uniref:PE domain-containing protein n=2 Tax=Mycobacterium stomatepiae TaxID=470076 RepID=A0A7I7QHR0_9MYCO|nr:PE family protein [Mycobacterium stomatepiae]BBY25670.1 hypothetical protein MSTO_58750 [Mycobacterium stomatepiae]
MSVMTVVPEVLTAARGELSGIGALIVDANRAAAAPTLGVVAPAADCVSEQVAVLFGGHAASYQSFSAHAGVFHQEFVRTLTAVGADYAQTEAANAAPLSQGTILPPRARPTTDRQFVDTRWHPAAAMTSRLGRPGAGDKRPIVSGAAAASNRSTLTRPGLLNHAAISRELGTPHNDLRGGILNGTRGVVQQIIQNQINYLKTIATALQTFLHDEIAAIEALPAAFKQAFQDLFAGHIKQSMNDVLRGFAHLFIDGMQWDGQQVASGGSAIFPSRAWMEAVFTGPLTDLAPIWQIPEQELQHTADLLKPLGLGILGNTVQNLADALKAWNDGWHVYFGQDVEGAGLKIGAPLALMFDVLGAPALATRALEDGLQATLDTLVAGHPLKAMLDFVATPAKVMRAFLFGQGYLELPPFAAKGVEYDGAVHLGGIFAPLGLGKEQVTQLWDGQWAEVTDPNRGTYTGGIVAALWSMMMGALRGLL